MPLLLLITQGFLKEWCGVVWRGGMERALLVVAHFSVGVSVSVEW
jgi:hypothetical protein